MPTHSSDPYIQLAIRRWANGEDSEASFRLIVEAYYSRLHRFFTLRAFDQERAHDLTQETFVRVYTGLAGFRAEASFESWLFTVAANVLRQFCREQATLKRGAGMVIESLEEQTRDPVLAEAGPLELAIQQQQASALRRAVDALPPKMRAVLKLHLYQGRSRRQIAEALGISQETVKAHLLQARRRLKELVATQEDDS